MNILHLDANNNNNNNKNSNNNNNNKQIDRETHHNGHYSHNSIEKRRNDSTQRQEMSSRFIEHHQSTTLLGWPTDILSVDKINISAAGEDPNPNPVHTIHTIIIHIPGNPGQYNWYNSDFRDILSGLGDGYSLRSISHAGHGLINNNSINNSSSDSNNNSIVDVEDHCRRRSCHEESASASIPWTVDGQVLHKIAYIDSLLLLIKQHSNHSRFIPNPKFIWMGHSFGCHIIQRICVLRKDILKRTEGFLFLMPYIRTFPNNVIDQKNLNFCGNNQNHLINIGTRLSQTIRLFPESVVRSLIRNGMKRDDDEITNLTTTLLRQPIYPQNFLQLGTEEIRDIPNEIDVTALRLLSSSSSSNKGGGGERPIFILYAGDNDQWCPYFHGEEIISLQSVNVLPSSIKITKIPGLRHDYVCQNRVTRSKVNDWCISNISSVNNTNANPSTSDDGDCYRSVAPNTMALASKL